MGSLKQSTRIDSLVVVHWEDALRAGSGWVGPEGPFCTALIRTVGWVVANDKRSVTLAASVGTPGSAHEEIGEVITIPRGCIVVVQELDC